MKPWPDPSGHPLLRKFDLLRSYSDTFSPGGPNDIAAFPPSLPPPRPRPRPPPRTPTPQCGQRLRARLGRGTPRRPRTEWQRPATPFHNSSPAAGVADYVAAAASAATDPSPQAAAQPGRAPPRTPPGWPPRRPASRGGRGPRARRTHRVEVPFRTSHIMHLKASALFRKVQTLQSQ